MERFSSIYNKTNSRLFQQLKNSCHTSIGNQKKCHIRHFKYWLRLLPFSHSSPSNPGGHKHRYPLRVNPARQVALFWHWELSSQAFWRRKKQWKDKRKKEGLIEEETKYRMIEYTNIYINICTSFYIIQRRQFRKNRFVTHLRATIINIGISYQVTVIFQMRGVIKFTDANCSITVRIFFEVNTDTIVVQVAK